MLDPLKDISNYSNTQMNSYVEQCMSIKKEIFDFLATLHKQGNQRKDQYVLDAKNAMAELMPFINEARELSRVLKEDIRKAKKQLNEEANKLKEQYEMGSICINTITKRMDVLESYIKNERFHDLVKDICDLEDKFEKEAIKLVQKRMSTK